MALTRVSYPSPNYSSRGGSGVRLIVVHTAEGATTYPSLGAYFANPAVQASSHTGIDDTPGTVGEYVRRDLKAWTQANANPYCVSTELCAFAAWDAAEWSRHPTMLQTCAQWIAEEAAAFGIPIVRLTAAQAQGGVAGVCGHNELGAAGGGHWDPGPDFPWADVINMAAGHTPAPAPTGWKGPDDLMIVGQDQMTGKIWLIAGNRKLEFPAGGGSPGGYADVYVGELINMIRLAYPDSNPQFVPLNPDIVNRIPDA